MRILVADQNALLLAAIAATFGRHCEVVTATRRDACMEHVEQRKFDVVVACEKLADYTGLELLSEVEAVSPATLRIFAARPENLKRLGKRLDFFGLLGTLSYPIDARKLLLALKAARARLPARPKPPKVRHVVLETEWDTGERLALLEQEIEASPAPAASSVEATFEVSFDENPSRLNVTSHEPPAADAPPALEVSFDENPIQSAPVAVAAEKPVTAVATNEPVEEEPPPADARDAQSPSYSDDDAANDDAFSGEPARAPAPMAKHRSANSPAAQPTEPRAARAPASAKVTSPAAQPAGPKQAVASGSAATTPAATKASATKTSATTSARKYGAKGPRPRIPTVPTAAQREAFQRALARRNAAVAAGKDFSGRGNKAAGRRGSNVGGLRANADPVAGLGTGAGADTRFSASTHFGVPGGSGPGAMASPPSQSLAALARMATSKRPLPGSARRGAQPKRGVVVGSGIAALLLVGVVSFELLRASPPVDHGRHSHAATVQLFGPTNSTLMADRSASPPPVFSAPSREPAFVPAPAPTSSAGLPQPQSFNPDTAPPDPPPPPALERPGPMEPPSRAQR
jgi:CheY-like chemotaxis protein